MIKELIEDFKAWRRGEKRVAPRGSRGRVYERADGSTPSGIEAKGRATATLEMVIKRVDGTEEVIVVPAKVM